jgi:hypothetical protein
MLGANVRKKYICSIKIDSYREDLAEEAVLSEPVSDLGKPPLRESVKYRELFESSSISLVGLT